MGWSNPLSGISRSLSNAGSGLASGFSNFGSSVASGANLGSLASGVGGELSGAYLNNPLSNASPFIAGSLGVLGGAFGGPVVGALAPQAYAGIARGLGDDNPQLQKVANLGSLAGGVLGAGGMMGGGGMFGPVGDAITGSGGSGSTITSLAPEASSAGEFGYLPFSETAAADIGYLPFAETPSAVLATDGLAGASATGDAASLVGSGWGYDAAGNVTSGIGGGSPSFSAMAPSGGGSGMQLGDWARLGLAGGNALLNYGAATSGAGAIEDATASDMAARESALARYNAMMENPSLMYQNDPGLRELRRQRMADARASLIAQGGGLEGGAAARQLAREGAAIDRQNLAQMAQMNLAGVSATDPAFYPYLQSQYGQAAAPYAAGSQFMGDVLSDQSFMSFLGEIFS